MFRNRIQLTQKDHDLAHLAELGAKPKFQTYLDAQQGCGFTLVGNTVMPGCWQGSPQRYGGDLYVAAIGADRKEFHPTAWNPCHDVLVAGNLVDGKMQWTDIPKDYLAGSANNNNWWWFLGRSPGTSVQPRPLPASLFLKSKPAFWGDKPWPCVGADVDGGAAMIPIPAQDWYARMQKAGHPIPFDAVPPAAGPATGAAPAP